MQAALLSIGDELALGQTVDTNAAWLAARLARLGIACHEHRTVADDLDRVTAAIRACAEAAELLIITGGLGPTDDDLTRPALAKAMGVELVEDPGSVDQIEAYFLGRGRTMPPRNRVQATHPQTSAMIPNSCGTAPGIDARLGLCRVFGTPGVPREMKAMYERSIEPAILGSGGSGRTILTAKINTFGQGESDIAELLGSLMARGRNPVVGTTVSQGLVSVRVRAEYPEVKQARHELESTAQEVEAKIGPIAFGREDDTLQESLTKLLIDRRLTVATAESCTGGLISGMLTDVPGSSAVVLGGWVTYANAMKIEQLGVDPDTLQAGGAVSGATVRQMASGALEQSASDLAIATSGIAGPGGGTEDKPVGTVWFGLAWREGETIRTTARLARLAGDRQAVRDRSAKIALQMLRLHVMGKDLSLVRWLVPDPHA
ncbi:MAG: competence/damage-inducible protein A [Planctomycetota bacterium]